MNKEVYLTWMADQTGCVMGHFRSVGVGMDQSRSRCNWTPNQLPIQVNL